MGLAGNLVGRELTLCATHPGLHSQYHISWVGWSVIPTLKMSKPENCQPKVILGFMADLSPVCDT